MAGFEDNASDFLLLHFMTLEHVQSSYLMAKIPHLCLHEWSLETGSIGRYPSPGCGYFQSSRFHADTPLVIMGCGYSQNKFTTLEQGRKISWEEDSNGKRELRGG